MELTVAIDDEVFARASERAQRLGISVEELVRRHLEDFGHPSSRIAATDELLQLMIEQPGDSAGRRFSRSDAYAET